VLATPVTLSSASATTRPAALEQPAMARSHSITTTPRACARRSHAGSTL
jgi:hypothetical protein